MEHCIIVGVGPGLGEAIARRFGREGQRLGLIARDAGRLDAIARGLGEAGLEACTAAADAADPAALRKAIRTLEARNGPGTTLVYNAAVLRPEPPLSLDPERLRAELDVNVTGALVAAQSLAPAMIARGSGALLFTGGGLALEPFPEWTSLALGKSALRSLAFCLHKELGPQGIQVAVVAVCGIVAPGTLFDPDVIAEAYWQLAGAAPAEGRRELIYRPAGSDPHYNDPVHRRPPTDAGETRPCD